MTPQGALSTAPFTGKPTPRLHGIPETVKIFMFNAQRGNLGAD